ncbi:hypothetical protein [Allosphingosinicella indica]|uniref:hypothetical protein n=1 Tax=Allosphingosinicella indica TaxID=941907 RepID=UPI001AEC9865|nr:hypothetical protein [Allosphingosinicella indica]
MKSASSKGAIDAGMAGFAALAVAFVAFAMPGDLFEAAVLASGLPALLPAAAPPLGNTARLGVGAIAALLSFGGLFLLLRALGPGPRRATADAPRVRRADAHPDAPSRRPIRAGDDLGEPAFDWPAPALAEAPPQADEVPVVEAEALAEPEPFPLSEDYAFPEAEAAPPPARPTEDESIPGLMERLESGLAHRARRVRRREVPPVTREDFVPLPGELRLQSAIDSLQKLARDR